MTLEEYARQQQNVEVDLPVQKKTSLEIRQQATGTSESTLQTKKTALSDKTVLFLCLRIKK